ncbi:MAG: DoxX family protein [Actinomycetota bacterium]
MFILASVLAAVVGGAFVLLGLAKVAERSMMVDARVHLGIPKALWRVIGALEIVGGAGLIVGLHEDLPAVGVLAAAGLVGMTIGATYYHQRAEDRIPEWLPAVAAGTLAIFYGIARVGSA